MPLLSFLTSSTSSSDPGNTSIPSPTPVMKTINSTNAASGTTLIPASASFASPNTFSLLKRELLDLRAQLSSEQKSRMESQLEVAKVLREKAELELVVEKMKRQMEERQCQQRTRRMTLEVDEEAEATVAAAALLAKPQPTTSTAATTSTSSSTTTSSPSLPPSATPSRPTSKRGSFATKLTSLLDKVWTTPSLDSNVAVPETTTSASHATEPKAPVDEKELMQLRFVTEHFYDLLSDTERELLQLQDQLTQKSEEIRLLKRDNLLTSHIHEQVRTAVVTINTLRADLTFQQQLATDYEDALEKSDEIIETLTQEKIALQEALDQLSSDLKASEAKYEAEKNTCAEQGTIISVLTRKVEELQSRLESMEEEALDERSEWMKEKRKVMELMEAQAKESVVLTSMMTSPRKQHHIPFDPASVTCSPVSSSSALSSTSSMSSSLSPSPFSTPSALSVLSSPYSSSSSSSALGTPTLPSPTHAHRSISPNQHNPE